MKHWTKQELKSAKVSFKIVHKMGRINIESKEMKIKLYEMEEIDFNKLLEIFEKYGKTK